MPDLAKNNIASTDAVVTAQWASNLRACAGTRRADAAVKQAGTLLTFLVPSG
jgi:hypothetical protein